MDPLNKFSNLYLEDSEPPSYGRQTPDHFPIHDPYIDDNHDPYRDDKGYHEPTDMDRSPSQVMESIGGRVSHLRDLQDDQRRLKEEYELELQALEKKYAAKSAPLYISRAQIIGGKDDKGNGPVEDNSQAFRGPASGIPEFWLTAMLENQAISDMIQDGDSEALAYLTDIRVKHLESPLQGYQLLFDFAENEFFANSTLSKTYMYEKGDGDKGVFFGELEGDIIHWKRGLPYMDYSEYNEPITPSGSFFEFFNPPRIPSFDDPERELIEMRLVLEYGYGDIFKDQIIPNAIEWFTGEAWERR